MVIPLVAPRQVVFLAKSEYFTGTGRPRRPQPVAVHRAGLGPGRARRHPRRAGLAGRRPGACCARAKAFGIYPEGTRSRDGRLYRGRTGVAWLALTAGVPVVPVALEGTEHIQPVGARVPRIRKVTVRFGEPAGVPRALRLGAGGQGPADGHRRGDGRHPRPVRAGPRARSTTSADPPDDHLVTGEGIGSAPCTKAWSRT